MENIMSRLSPAVLTLSLLAAVAATPAEAAQRAFVNSSGSDGNTGSGCGLAAPCRTFAAAMTVVSDGGEIVALDAAGYGPVTVTKNVTITANPGFYAGIAVPTLSDGVTIATGGVNVILRGLNINNTGGTNGVNMTNGARLSIENCVISNFSGGNGVFVSANAAVRIVDSLIRDNLYGVYIQGGATAAISGSKIVGNANNSEGVYVFGNTANTTTTAAISDTIVTDHYIGVYAYSNTTTAVARMSVTRSTLSNNNNVGAAVTNGIAGAPALLIISNSMVTGNLNIGLYQNGTGATLRSLGNNTVDQNGTNTTGTITTVPGI
jgi:Right handed beta helix region